MESALPAAGFLYWVGAGTVAYLALRVSCSLFTALRVWGLGHEAGVGTGLGEWAGESDPGRLAASGPAWPPLDTCGPSAWPSPPQLPSAPSQAPASRVPAWPAYASSGLLRLAEFLNPKYVAGPAPRS